MMQEDRRTIEDPPQLHGGEATLAALDESKSPASVFFLGSTEPVLDALTSAVAEHFPGVRVAGTFSPPFRAHFRPADDREMCDRVNDAGASMLYVGLGALKCSAEGVVPFCHEQGVLVDRREVMERSPAFRVGHEASGDSGQVESADVYAKEGYGHGAVPPRRCRALSIASR